MSDWYVNFIAAVDAEIASDEERDRAEAQNTHDVAAWWDEWVCETRSEASSTNDRFRTDLRFRPQRGATEMPVFNGSGNGFSVALGQKLVTVFFVKKAQRVVVRTSEPDKNDKDVTYEVRRDGNAMAVYRLGNGNPLRTNLVSEVLLPLFREVVETGRALVA